METLLLFALAGPFALSAVLAALGVGDRRVVGWIIAAGRVISVGAAIALWTIAIGGSPFAPAAAGLFRVDALSALVACCVVVVGTISMALGPGTPGSGHDDPAARRKFQAYGNVFVLAMLLAVTVNNVALMWVAIEATTITSALLVPLHRSKASVEASWKYLLIGSVGIALAFAGTVLAYFDFVTITGQRQTSLGWPLLMHSAPVLDPGLLRLAFVFLLVGYGTKAGLAPMHTWLPDAHSEAPAPLSAMMSGVLLAVAQYAILRWKAVVDLTPGGAAFTNQVLLAIGLFSVLIGALSLVRQQSYKRLLAYSSVEHSGLICMGLAFGPAGVFASLLHMMNHALAKSTSFLLSGRILARYGSTDVDGVRGLVRTMPATGALFATGVLALMGLPPFGLFVSEFLLFRAGFTSGHVWETGVALVLAGIGFVGLSSHLLRMLYGATPDGVMSGERDARALAPIVVCAVALVVLGLILPEAVGALLGRIVEGMTA
ncbi:MAG: proton-conducting transporter membrane subunit [Acidobacteria bacterium]|nr:proton-conducting transporter membrane subunit [Acidobacteriota bacterium]